MNVSSKLRDKSSEPTPNGGIREFSVLCSHDHGNLEVLQKRRFGPIFDLWISRSNRVATHRNQRQTAFFLLPFLNKTRKIFKSIENSVLQWGDHMTHVNPALLFGQNLRSQNFVVVSLIIQGNFKYHYLVAFPLSQHFQTRKVFKIWENFVWQNGDKMTNVVCPLLFDWN